MLRAPLRPWYHACRNRLRFPQVRIGWATYLDRDCRLEPGALVGSHCELTGARLDQTTCIGDYCVIGRGSRFSGATLGPGCTVESETELTDVSLGEGVTIEAKCVLTQTRLGRGSAVARETYLNRVTVGNFASIGPRALLGVDTHPADLVASGQVFHAHRAGAVALPNDSIVSRQPITLGHDVWIGTQVVIRDGVHIADGAIVEAGSMVDSDVPSYAMVSGSPARIVRLRFSEAIIRRLLRLQWWHWELARVKAARPWFALSDPDAFLRWAEA